MGIFSRLFGKRKVSESKSDLLTWMDGKGNKDRLTMLPEAVKKPLLEHLKRVRQVHQRDLQEGYGRVHMPYVLERKYPNAARNGVGSMFFLRPIVLLINKLVHKEDITFMNQFYSEV